MTNTSAIEVVRKFFDELSGGDLKAISRHTSRDVA
jgi:hypothetical protein